MIVFPELLDERFRFRLKTVELVPRLRVDLFLIHVNHAQVLHESLPFGRQAGGTGYLFLRPVGALLALPIADQEQRKFDSGVRARLPSPPCAIRCVPWHAPAFR